MITILTEVTVLFKDKLKKFLIGFIAIIMMILTIAPTVVEASNMYFLAFTYDLDNATIQPTTYYSEVDYMVNNHVEVKSGFDGDDVRYIQDADGNLVFRMNDGAGSSKITIPGIGNMSSAFPSSVSGDYEYTLPFSFPGVQVNTGPVGTNQGGARNGTSSDEEQAGWVGNQLTNGFNRLLTIAYIAEHGNEPTVTKDHLASVAMKVATMGVNSSNHTFGKSTNREVTIKVNSHTGGTTDKHIDDAFYRTVSVEYAKDPSSNVTLNLPVEVNKGYSDKKSERMYGEVNGTPYQTESRNLKDVYSITWQHMVMQANMNAANDILVGNVQDLNPPGRIEATMVSMLGGLASGIRMLLGLDSVTNLVFNQGAYGDSTHLGVMPHQLIGVADASYLVILAISVIVLIGAFVKMLVDSNLSVINPQMRVNMKDSFLAIIGALFILAVFQPIWGSLMSLNHSLVTLFSGLSHNSMDFAGRLVTGGGLAGIFVAIAFLIVEIWFNVYYIVRTLTILFLYILSPLAIISIAFGGKARSIFTSWSKELLGALFIQSIHALVIGVISSGMDRGVGSSMIWQFVILLNVIPLSNLIRGTVMNLGGDSIGRSAEQAERGLIMGGAVMGGLALKGAGVAAQGFKDNVMGGSSESNIATSSSSPGGGGGGSRVGSSGGSGGVSSGGGSSAINMSDEAIDKSHAPVETGNAQHIKAGGSHAVDNFRNSKAVQALNSKPARAIASGVAQTAGAALTVGTSLGDLATGGGGSSQGVIAAQRMFGGKGSGAGGGGGGRLSSTEEIAQQAHPTKRLAKLESEGHVGSKGELSLNNTEDGHQILTSSKEALSASTGIEDIQALPSSANHRSGSTSMTLSDTTKDSEGNTVEMPAENKAALDYAAEISHANASGEGITREKREAYRDMKQNTGISNVSYDKESGKYNITMDNQAMNWEGTASNDNHFMVKASETADKNLPDFNTSGGTNTQRLKSWHNENKGISMSDEDEDSKATGS